MRIYWQGSKQQLFFKKCRYLLYTIRHYPSQVKEDAFIYWCNDLCYFVVVRIIPYPFCGNFILQAVTSFWRLKNPIAN